MNPTSLNIEDFLNHKYIKFDEFKDLIIFHYKEDCVYDKAWDEITKAARGIIFNKKTGELVARPWSKFFNLGEMPESCIDVLKDKAFYVLQKWDGSMGILYKYEGEYYVATKGSFTSEQAKWATEWARKHINFNNINDNFTYIFEIIYPQNKIVVNYGDMEELILTGVINKQDGKEKDYDELWEEGSLLKVKCAANGILRVFMSLNELAEHCKTLPHSQEGFVVTFPDTGFKLKIKGQEYLRIHKIISNLTPLAFYEAWDVKEKKIPDLYLAQVPEEFRTFTDEMNIIINKMHNDLYDEVLNEYDIMVEDYATKTKEPFDIKSFAIECQIHHKNNMSLLINVFKAQYDKMWDNIHKRLRPTGNILPVSYKVKCDIHGRLERINDN